ncbi:transglutaminase-like domain-containing protein [Aestuariibacter sp. AA17]|uniref:Transglutaminase-like domain-containing protein n=1 Tax=Fluctibacter corallii TaxID=2984329 RepID=A0ABT3A790_9ALTE|nr:transglutaminase-like domain-containing protein [Aestuariibacter sp. AA17]MCV2884439.1 transglutaminase-like domain-containing protein [Aestuariibacter sp. AA17]
MSRVACLIFVLTSFAVCGQQTRFSRSAEEGGVTLHYAWLDHQNDKQTLSLTYPLSLANTPYQKVKNYRPDVAQRHVFVELMRLAQKIDPREASVSVKQQNGRIAINVRSREQAMVDKWMAEMKQKEQTIYQDYLAANYYTRFTNFAGQTAIKPDHIRYIKDSEAFLQPIVQQVFEAVGSARDTRAYIDYVLSLIQAIPYDELQDKSISRGSGYMPPMDVLNNNLGDCDSKSALMAGLLRALIPGLSMAIVYLPDHALLAVNVPKKDNEAIVEIDGMRFLLMEPTGPAMLPAGEIADTSQLKIDMGMFSYERVP